ncbi:MAG: multiheme c-type cytochrome [Planctomycetota bacterium]|jgi:hypothetical protein|nr:multiheme c-type cytochrome [Planctomycetota bacterium]
MENEMWMVRNNAGRVLFVLPVFILVALVIGTALFTGNSDHGNTVVGPVSVIVSADTKGWITPCGCASNQSGGLLRRGTYLESAARTSEILYLDAGGAASGVSPYDKVKFEALLRGEQAMGLKAHNLGGAELALGADYLAEAAARLGAPFVSANVMNADGKPIVSPVRVIEAGGKTFGVSGVVSRKYKGDGLSTIDPREALLQVLSEERKVDHFIVLAYLPEGELKELAEALPEVDVIAGGPTGQSIQPEKVGPVLLGSATNKGKFLLHLDVPGDGQQWSGKVVEMGPDLDDQPAQVKNLKNFHAVLGEKDFSFRETSFIPKLPAGVPDDYRVAGTDSCMECHQNDCSEWSRSKHAHAWETLEHKGYHVDSYCQQCHTTGYGIPGGFESVGMSAKVRVQVGCENCHGPSYAHTQTPERRTPFVAQDQCIRCHDAENSPSFDYKSYWPRILHGATADTGSANGAR